MNYLREPYYGIMCIKIEIYFKAKMIGSVAGRHISTRRRGSLALSLETPEGPINSRRRRAVTTSDHKSCALIQTRLKLGDIM